MFLKRLELQGFKSFPEKIRLEFNEGLTAVVGPNGSGKSNIADAVRWVLGEQSAKSLRGGKMEDVIFAGTDARRALGFAEVSLVVDNADAGLALPFSEVTVTRRVFRSGESEYAINAAPCRLKDIHELFMDTGIGKEGYSIIGQGRIEEILSTRSEDRRLLFEEAAGIVKYKNRKAEAEQKLARERLNLERVSDMLDEISQRLEPLEEQSEAAKRYLDLKERLKFIQVNIFLDSAAKAELELEALEASLHSLNGQISARKNEQTAREAESAALDGEVSRLDSDLKNANDRVNNLLLEIGQIEGGINLSNERRAAIAANNERLLSEIENKRNFIAVLENAKTDDAAECSALTQKLAAKDSELKSKEDALAEFDSRNIESEQKIKDFHEAILHKIQEEAEIKSRIAAGQNRYEELERQKEQVSDDACGGQNALRAKREEIEVLKISSAETEAETVKFQKRNDEFLADKSRKDTDLAEKRDEIGKIHKAVDECSSRLKVLREFEERYEGYGGAVKTLLKNRERFPGLYGAVAELMSVPKEYEICIEIALGGAAQDIVAGSEADAKEAIEFLKKTNAGRATFLPLTSVKGKELSDAQILKEPGVIGTAESLVSYDAKFSGVFLNLLGRVIVFGSFDDAVAFSKKTGYNYKAVTLAGELINPGGAITGGSVRQSSGIFGRAREIAELTDRLDALFSKRTALTNEIDALKNQLNVLIAAVDDARENLQRLAIEKASRERDLKITRADAEELGHLLGRLAERDAALMESIRQTNLEIREIRGELAVCGEKAGALRKDLSDYENSMSAERAEKDALMRTLMEIKAEAAALGQNKLALEQKISRASSDIENSLAEISRHEEEIKRNESAMREREADAQTAREKIEQKNREREGVLAAAVELEAQKESRAARKRELEKIDRDALEIIGGLTNERTRAEMKLEQAAAENRRRYDEMWDEYNFTLKSAKEYAAGFTEEKPSAAAALREERRLKNELTGLGAVNVNAIEEYRALKERVTFVSGQRADIVEAEKKLSGVIADLEEMMARQFEEQFKLISENFSAVFREMFGGGTASLRLTDESSVLDAGIEISAQPPGKKLQNMLLLSGGERALTAIALLFGILRMKPSPFCILDEIEAALDDANVARFADYLKKFAAETQFIVITHRKGTMAAADVLYGVTMQEQGVSKLVSVEMKD